MQQNKYKKLMSDTLAFTIGNMGSKLILFLLVPLYTNYLSTEEYGISELIATISNLIIPFVTLVISDGVLRFVLDDSIENENVLRNAVIVLTCGTVVSFVLIHLVGLYPPLAKWKYLLFEYIVSNMWSLVMCSYIKAKENTRLFVVLGIMQTLIMALLNMLFLIVFRKGVEGYLSSNIISQVVILAVAISYGGIYRDLKKSHYDKPLMFAMLSYSAPLVLNNVSWWVVQSLDKIMIEMMIGSAALGLYTVASKIPALINVLVNIFAQAWGISSIKEFDNSRDEKFYSNIFSGFTFLIFLFTALAITFIKWFFPLYVGPDFISAWKYIPLLLLASTFSAISAYFGSIYSALKKSTNVMISTVVAAVVNIIMNSFLIRRIGVLGAAYATALAYALCAVYRLIDSRRFYRFSIKFNAIIIEILLLISQSITVTYQFNGEIVSLISIAFILYFNKDWVNQGLKIVVNYIQKMRICK